MGEHNSAGKLVAPDREQVRRHELLLKTIRLLFLHIAEEFLCPNAQLESQFLDVACGLDLCQERIELAPLPAMFHVKVADPSGPQVSSAAKI